MSIRLANRPSVAVDGEVGGGEEAFVVDVDGIVNDVTDVGH